MGHKILLVEDDPCFGSVLKSYLELSDYDVIHCTNGVDGFEAFRKEKFDLCLLDVMMPEMDGFTLGKKIRELLHQRRDHIADGRRKRLIRSIYTIDQVIERRNDTCD